jgi:hypothetical protein
MGPEEAQLRLQLAYDYLRKELDDIASALDSKYLLTRDADQRFEAIRRDVQASREHATVELQRLRSDFDGHKNGVERRAEDVKREADKRHENVHEVLKGYTTKVEFEPVKKVVFGMIGVVLLAVLTALVALVVNSRGGG